MSFEILEDITLADIAFRAAGDTLEDLFVSSARALLSVMIEDPSLIEKDLQVEFVLSEEEIDLLLFSFLQELVFYKDSESLLLVPGDMEITKTEDGYSVRCRAYGEKTDRTRHVFMVDVKSVTFHRLCVENKNHRWVATVVLDV